MVGRPDVHVSRLQLAGLRGLLVCREHRRVGALELQGNAFAHDAGRVDGVDQGVDVRGEQVARYLADHRRLHMARNTSRV